MLKEYLIHKEGCEGVGKLYYDTETEKFRLEVFPDAVNKWIPLPMLAMARRGILNIDHDIAYLFVRERVFPPDRANIGAILRELGLQFYREDLLLDKMKGKNVMDDYLIERCN